MFEKVNLAFKHYPAKEIANLSVPILILHGLFGSSKNWVAVADYLTEFSEVYSLDLRNHGDSPHSSDHTLAAMSEDILEFLNDRKISKAIFLAHSMGGLVAMTFVLNHPDFVDTLIIQDIAPRDYEFTYEAELSVLQTDVSKFKTRQELDQAVSYLLPNPFIRNFLLMNLERREEGGYRWKLNVQAIADSKRIFQSQFLPGQNVFSGKVLFVLGGSSEYFLETDKEAALKYFPNAKFETIPEGDHYIHFTKAPQFQKIVTDFLKNS